MQDLKGVNTLFIDLKKGVFREKIGEEASNLGKVFNKMSVKIDVPQERLDFFDRVRHRQFGDQIDLRPVNLDTSLRYDMFKDDALENHKMALLPRQDQIGVYASVEDCGQMREATIKCLTKHREVIHEVFQVITYHFRKYG